MGIFDGRRPTIKVDPPRPRLRINNGTAVDPLLPPSIPNINLNFGRSVMPQLKAQGLEDLPNQLQSLVSKAQFGKYKFTFSQQDGLLNPKVVSAEDVIKNTPIYLAANEGLRQVGFPKYLEVGGIGHHFNVGPDMRMAMEKLGDIENIPTLNHQYKRSVLQEGFIHINPLAFSSPERPAQAVISKLGGTVFHELGHAVSEQAGRSLISNDELRHKTQLIYDHFSGGLVPDSTLAVGQPVNINTVADYLGETLATRLRQSGIEEARADTMKLVSKAMSGDINHTLRPITGQKADTDMWRELWYSEEITPPSGYSHRGVLTSTYAQPFAQYIDSIDSQNGLPVPVKSGGTGTVAGFHDDALNILGRHPQFYSLSDKEKGRLMSRVATVAEARTQAAYLAHLGAPENMQESVAVSLINQMQSNVKSFDSHGINFLQMFREEAENAGGLNATMLTAESADQTIVAKSFGTWMKRAINQANRTARAEAPIGSISSIKAIKGVTKAARDGGSYAITESLRAVGKAGESAPRSAVMTATTLERMLESAATALKVVRKV
jgi:hypothetical protein